MFGKRFFYVPLDDDGPVVTRDYDQVKVEIRKRRIKQAKTWLFLILGAIGLIWVFSSVLSGDVALFRNTVIAVMVICGAIGVYNAHKSDRNTASVILTNVIAVACFGIGTVFLIPLLFQHSDMFRHAMASVTGHESFDGSVGIVGHTPWYLMLISLGIVAFLVYGLMVIAIIASLSSLMHVGDDKYVGDKPKKPKRKKLVVKRQDDETDHQFSERKKSEYHDYAKAVKSAENSYRNYTLQWRYRKMVSTGMAPIWLSLIAVVCSMLYISESYFNAIF